MPNRHLQLLRSLFDTAVAAAQPALCLPPCLPPPPAGRTLVLGAGKAAAAMAQTLEQRWVGPLSGLVVTQHGYALPCERIEVIEAAHPLPDADGLAAARRMFGLTSGLREDDLVIALFSGGGSALLPLPFPGVNLEDKRAITGELLRSGASIRDINCVRRHLSAIKGGRLALACAPARVLTLLISDVPGDHPADIASGPTVGDRTCCADALAVLERYQVVPPPGVEKLLRDGTSETPKPGDGRLQHCATRIIATAGTALQAAAEAAIAAGVEPVMLGAHIEGEAREVAGMMGARALKAAQYSIRPRVLLAGGETTVTVRGSGSGGRNAEFLLALAQSLGGHPRIHALAADTDGKDGMANAAGAVIGPDTLLRARKLGLDAERSLDRNDSHGFFAALGDQLVTGPTYTNVNDFRAILIA